MVQKDDKKKDKDKKKKKKKDKDKDREKGDKKKMKLKEGLFDDGKEEVADDENLDKMISQ